MTVAFGRDVLLDAFDRIGRAAVEPGTKLPIAVYGGSALMLASNFRSATEDVDIAEIGQPWPAWLSDTVDQLAWENAWSSTWLNDAVSFHLSALARADRDLTAFGTFPRRDEHTGLVVFVPTARYMLALKLKALRISDFEKGVLAEFFPNSAADADKQRFVLKRLFTGGTSIDAPHYPRPDR